MALLSAPFTPQPGKIVIFGEWTGSEYVEHQGYIRTIQSTPGGPNEPTINLSYSNGVNLAQANNVRNIEIADIGANEDYWRAQFDPQAQDSRPFATQYRPAQGEVVWVAIYDATEAEHFWFLGFVRALVGAPTDDTPILNLSYYDSRAGIEADVNANNVDPVEEAGATDNHWFKVSEVSA